MSWLGMPFGKVRKEVNHSFLVFHATHVIPRFIGTDNSSNGNENNVFKL